MSRETLVELTRRTLRHARAGTVPLAGGIGRVPASNYYDPDRWQLEMERVFKRTPLALGFTCELPERRNYKALEVAGVPVLLSRGADGQMRAFVNMCSHRGSIVVPEGTGTARRFTCPYHAWSYDSEGRLVGILDREEFGDLDPDCHGLTPLPVAERAGIIFGALTPGAPFDIDAYLCGYGEMLAHHEFASCAYVGSQAVDGPNWKVAYDGYLDFYHLPILHRETFGPGYSNKAIYDAWGPHQRVTSPDRRFLALDSLPEDDWPADLLTDGVWTIFPHASVAGFGVGADEVPGGGRMYMISTLFPGDTPDTSRTVQHFLAAFELSEQLEGLIDAQKAFLLHVVRDEDYYNGNRIQRAVKTGAKTEFFFGRNEAGGQRFHGWVDRLVAAETDDDFANLFTGAETSFQR
ncbi:aromatic ring-hydroxylating oxygenase subunit alpha [Candidatus Poriferisodalis sp.]|uniref:aromatic ring-hydroxylating oxygenase subunit alpha n=1 Tax=Candidatus Poriferisodalis sp. TaxID=3101277 RepID=UPI003B5C118F